MAVVSAGCGDVEVLCAMAAAATTRIRVGARAVQLGHRTSLSVVELFGSIDAFHPGRIDLGLGRSGHRKAGAGGTPPAKPPARVGQTVDGLLILPGFSFATLARSPLFGLYSCLLQQPAAQSIDFAEQVAEIIALLNGTYVSAAGKAAHALPGEGRRPPVVDLGQQRRRERQSRGRARSSVRRRPPRPCWKRSPPTGRHSNPQAV